MKKIYKLLLGLSFLICGINVKAQYCNTNLGGSGCSGDNITNVSILGTSFNNNSTCTTTPTNGTYSQFAPSPSTTATLNIGLTYTISVFTTASNIESVWIDYNQNGTFDASEHTQITLSSTANSATTATFTIPGTALLGQTGLRVRSRATGNPNGPTDACTSFGSGEAEDYTITIGTAAPCAGAPGANTVVATTTAVCANGNVTLSLANSYTVGGLTYQWFTSTAAAGPYTAVSGATTSIYGATNVTTSLYYRAVITCTNGPASTTATPVQVIISTNPCQCTSYCASNATSTLYDEIYNVSISTLNNTSSCAQTGGPGSILNEYSNYAGILSAPNLVGGVTYSLGVTVGQCGVTFANSGIVTAYIDYNNNGLFTDPGELVYTSPYTSFLPAGTTVTANITIPTTITPGIRRMRIIEVESSVAQPDCGTYFAGETEDYCVNLLAPVPCSGAPASNSAVASSSAACPNGTVTLSLANTYTTGGLTYQWFTSTAAAGPYTAVSGATNSIYTSTNVTTPLYYRAVITCTNGPASTTSTPVQVIINNNPCQCSAYCNTSFPSQTADDEIFNVSIGTLNNTSSCSQTGSAPTSTLSLYSNYTGIVAAPSLTVANNYTLNVTVGQCNTSAYSGGVTVYMDFNNNGSFTDPGEQVYASPSTLWAVAGTLNTTVITIPANATPGITRMRVIAAESNVGIGSCVGYGYGETEDYCINIAAGTPCAGAPAANSAVASQTNVCPGGLSNLSLATSYTLGGLTYQWYTSPTVAGPYTAVTGATTSAYTFTNITTSLFYRAVITCTNGPASTTSTPIQVMVGGTPCQCAAFCASNATSIFDAELFNVSIGTLNNTSNCSQTGSAPTSTLSLYSNYTGILVAPNLAAGLNYTLSVTAGQCNNFPTSGIVTAYMDFNQNGSFGDPGELVYSSPYGAFAVAGTTFTTVINVPANATLGTSRIRVIASQQSTPQADCGTYFNGETEDYCINITAPTPCAGAPGANTAVASATNVCPSSTSTLSLANSYTVGGLTFQWFSSPTVSGPYTAISGATLSTYSATNLATSLYYQAVITCTNGPASTTSSPVQVLVGGSPCQCAAYCTSNAVSTNDEEIFNVSIGTLNNTSACGQTGGPTSTVSLYSNYTGVLASTNLAAGLTYTFSTTVGECSGNSYSGVVAAYIDFNQNGSFSDPGENVYLSPYGPFAVAGTTFTAPVTIPANATLGTTRIRVVATENSIVSECGTNTWGETEDYCITITAPTPCAGAPGSNAAISSATTVCPSGSATLSLANSYTVGGLTYQWFSSPAASGPYTAISGATLNTYPASNLTTSLYYYAVITCTNGPASTTSTPVQIQVGGNSCICAAYCTNSANSTADDEIFNVTLGTLNNTSNCSQTGGAGSILNRYSNYAGMLATPNIQQNGTYTLDVTVGQCGTFAYSGGVTVYIDFDQNGSFADPGEQVFVGPSTTWAIAGTLNSTVITIPATASLGVTRMRVIAAEGTIGAFDCGTYGWGETEDYCINITAGCTAPNVSVTASPTIVCNGNPVTLTASGATTYTWNTTAQTASISVTPSVNTTYTVVGENAPGCPSTKTIAVTVNPSPTLAVSPSPSICPGGNAVISATSSASNYTWNPGNFTAAAITVSPSISTVYNVATTNSLGCVTNSNVTVFVVVCTGLAKNTVIDNNTFVYPNPNSGSINVVIHDVSGNYSFEVLDLSGRVVYKTTLSKAENALSIKELANGMYTYKITSLTTRIAIKEGKLIKE